MSSSFSAPAAAALILAAALAGPAGAAEEANVRLLVAGVEGTKLVAGVEIVLPEGWKTYWRTPGEAGIPPSVDFAGSQGLAETRLLYPAPVRFDEAGLTAVGYDETVILPVEATVSGAGELGVDVHVGLCHEVCVPLETKLKAAVDPAAPVDTAVAARIEAARDRVPVAAKTGTRPFVTALRKVGSGAGATVQVDVAMPPDSTLERDVFVEGPSGTWALPMPERHSPPGSHETWAFAIDGVPKGEDIAHAPLRFTIVAGERAIEQSMRLDGGAVAP